MKRVYVVMMAAALIGFAGCSNPESPETTKETLQGTVEIAGTARVGETLTAVTGGIANGTGTASYLWKRGTETIAGASGATYTVAAADEGKTITVTVSFSGNNGSLTSEPTAAALPEDPTKQTLQGMVSISGTARVGETLTADISGITNGTGTASYLWKRGSEIIAAAGGGSYTLTGGDEQKSITVTVSFSGNNGSLTSESTAMVQPEGEGGQATDIPAFNFDSTTTNVTVPKTVNNTSFSSASYSNAAQSGLSNVTLPSLISKFVKQDENLINGYGAVAGKYPDSAVFAQLKNAETAMKNGWTSGNDMAGTNAEGIINALFANATTAERKAFEAELSAYQVGTYFEQKERFAGNNKYNPSNDPSRQELINRFKDLVDAADIGITVQEGTGLKGGDNGPIVTNMNAILAALKARLIQKIDAATGVDGIENTTNRARVKELNGNLFTQIAEDAAQYMALFADVIDAGFKFEWDKILQKLQNYLTMGAQKAGRIGDGNNFDPQYLIP